MTFLYSLACIFAITITGLVLTRLQTEIIVVANIVEKLNHWNMECETNCLFTIIIVYKNVFKTFI